MADKRELNRLRTEVRDRVDDLRSQLQIAEDGYLQHCGWTYTSNTPDSVWVWIKKWGDITYAVSRSRALQMEGVHDA